VVACPPGHRFESMTEVPIKEISGEAYLICSASACSRRSSISQIGRQR